MLYMNSHTNNRWMWPTERQEEKQNEEMVRDIFHQKPQSIYNNCFASSLIKLHLSAHK